MTTDEKVNAVFKLATENVGKGQRYGQALFNAATVIMPKAAESARGDFLLDPFYVDKNVNVFLAHLYEVGE